MRHIDSRCCHWQKSRHIKRSLKSRHSQTELGNETISASYGLEQAKKTTAEQAAQDKKARYQKAFNDFLLLSENQQEELKQTFFEKSDSVIKIQIKDSQRKGIDIFTSPLVSSPFKVFLVENGF
ncbi:MAG: hypothetical protein NTW85_00035 [Methylococcales bacterium]|nr:hypothetical protein [Methylococcales bacterium]